MLLREVEPGDLQTEHQRDPQSARMAAFTPRELEPFMLHWRTKILNQPVVRARTIVIDGVVCGYVSSFFAEGLRLVCYWIARERWGQRGAHRELRLSTATKASTGRVGSTLARNSKCGFSSVPHFRIVGRSCAFWAFGRLPLHRQKRKALWKMPRGHVVVFEAIAGFGD
jgi:hypothetical protein